ncbi:MAG: FAD-binding and (Fe-S)-binding domain-containing protein [Rhodothermales bacterium]
MRNPPRFVMPTPRLADFADALTPRLRGTLKTDPMTRSLYSTDASMYQMQPLGVLIPAHADDVQAALEEAYKYDIPILARGGASSLAGQTVGEALVIDFTKHLNAILDINREAKTVRVQPGLVLETLNHVLAPHGLVFGPDPASAKRATLGGMLANNSTGTHSLLYGNVIHHVDTVATLLSDGSRTTFGPMDGAQWSYAAQQDGTVAKLYRDLGALVANRADIIERDTPKHWRRNSGYRLEALLEAGPRNVAQVLCGSEGTLAIATEMTLKLVDKPKQTALGVVQYRTRRESLEAVTEMLTVEPSAIELFDGVTLDQIRRSPGFAHRLNFIIGDPGSLQIVEFFGDTEAELKAKLDALERIAVDQGTAYGMVRVFDAAGIQNVWAVRREGLGIIMNVPGDYKPIAFVEDAAVPVEHLADYIEHLADLLERTNTKAAMYAHASGGCLHVRPFINLKDAADIEKMRDLAWGSMELVKRYGGYVSSEHGDGLARSWLNDAFLGPDLMGVYKELKDVFDPKGIMNPGKIIDAPPMTDNLRMGPKYNTVPILTDLDFSDVGGFEQAFELCNGCGSCRKTDTGTMCPSFMVTGDEMHTTRGRANALRNVMSGNAEGVGLTGDEMYEAMDLCLQCKGCKTECPSNVDMAKLKTEWLNQYWREHKMPFRTRFFGSMPAVAPYVAGPLANIANRVNKTAPMRWLLDKTLGVSRERQLPDFAAKPFVKTYWKKAHRQEPWPDPARAVVLFSDTFNNFQDPHISRAAHEFLTKAGYRVIIPTDSLCCGRTFLSKGMVNEAQVRAIQTVETLYPYASQGLPIVGLEPSCILTLHDEFRSMLAGDPRVHTVADQAMLFETFVAREADAGHLDEVQWTDESREVLFHGHCHQKAMVGTSDSERALGLPSGYRVTVVDSGCCGMAGSFGYEKEHVELSKAMAERRLAPAVRAASEDTIIAAPGTSCRHQIHDTASRHALHPAEVLRDAIIGVRAEVQAPAETLV